MDVTITGHVHSDVCASWMPPRPNGAPIDAYAFQIRTIEAKVDAHGAILRAAPALTAGLAESMATISILPSFEITDSYSRLELGNEGVDHEDEDEDVKELQSPTRRRHAGRSTSASTQTSLLSTVGALRGPSSGTTSGNPVMYERLGPLPSVERVASHLAHANRREPGPEVALDSLDLHHPFMWQFSQWVARPPPPKPTLSEVLLRGSYTLSPPRDAIPLQATLSKFASDPLPVTVDAQDSIMPFLPSASAESLPVGEALSRATTLSEPMVDEATLLRSKVPTPETPGFGGLKTPALTRTLTGSLVSTAALGLDKPRSIDPEDWINPVLRTTRTLVLSTRKSSRSLLVASPGGAAASRGSPSIVTPSQKDGMLSTSATLPTTSVVTGGMNSSPPSVVDSLKQPQLVAAVPERPVADDGWLNTGDIIQVSCWSDDDGTMLSGFVRDVAPECDVYVRCFARNKYGWSLAGEVSQPYWMPDCPSLVQATSRSLRITLGTRGQPPFQLQLQVCQADVWNGAPLGWTPAQQ